MALGLVYISFCMSARLLSRIITLPLGVLAAFIVMSAQGITANIMSLGGIAIAIGAMVDASIVMVENAHRKLSELPKDASREEKNTAILLATKEVGPGLFFSLLIITVSFLPVFALTGQSYRLFSPLAFTKTYAHGLCLYFVRHGRADLDALAYSRQNPKRKKPTRLIAGLLQLYRATLAPWAGQVAMTVIIAIGFIASMAVPIMRTGSEFMPALYEGELALYADYDCLGFRLPKPRKFCNNQPHDQNQLPEVHHVFGKVGRADTATDPAPISMIETWIRLKPRDEWRKGTDRRWI